MVMKTMKAYLGVNYLLSLCGNLRNPCQGIGDEEYDKICIDYDLYRITGRWNSKN